MERDPPSQQRLWLRHTDTTADSWVYSPSNRELAPIMDLHFFERPRSSSLITTATVCLGPVPARAWTLGETKP